MKDIIIRGGENIVRVVFVVTSRASLNVLQDCTSIENALYAESAVLEAAAVGVLDERLGELPVAVVFVKDGMSSPTGYVRIAE